MPDYAYDPLEVVKEDDTFVYFLQPEFSDADCYRVGWDGCFLTGDIADRETQAADPSRWSLGTHYCDIDRLIAHLTQIRDYARAKWGKDGGAWRHDA